MIHESTTANVYYETHGEKGEWITLINGHTRTLRDFKMFSRKLNNAGFRVLLVDNRGAGETKTDFPFSLEDIAEDIFEIWLELDITASHVLGISMGGMISQILASKHTDIVSSLILISSSASDHYLSDLASSDWGNTVEDIEKKLSHYFAKNFYEKNKLLVTSMAKVMLKKQNNGFDEGAYLQRQAINESDIDGIQRSIDCRTLILHGEEDAIINVEAANYLNKKIVHSRTLIFSGVGHLLLAEMPKITYDSCIDFLLDN